MTSVHWYKATSEAFNTPVTLLEEDQIRKEMTNLAEIVRVSNRYHTTGSSSRADESEASALESLEQQTH